MFKRLIMFLVILICGYLLIEWITIDRPFVPSEFFIGLIMSPLEFLAAMLACFIGVIFSGRLIHDLVHKSKNTRKKNTEWVLSLLIGYLGLCVIFVILFQLGREQTIVFFSLSLLYGMISLEH